MRIMTTILLMSLAMVATGCNSRDAKEVRSTDKAVKNHAGADMAGGDARFAPVVSVPAVNQAAGQATEAIHTAAVDVDRAAVDANRTAARAQADAQEVTNDAARLSNDAAKAGNSILNNAARDLDRMKNVLP